MVSYRNRRRYSNSRNVGRERARQHIQEAQEFSQTIGGTDEDVKKWFFSRSNHELKSIFQLYRKKFGDKPADYAEEAYPDWKSEKRYMSGRVATRLFSLLPPIMPMKDKFHLVDTLWEHVGPTKKRLITAGYNANKDEVIALVKKEIGMLTTNWTIPDEISARFKWLSANDSHTYQKLLSHIKESERQLGLNIIKEQIPILIKKFESDWSESASRLSYVIEVGKQSIELRFEGDSNVAEARDWYKAYYSSSAKSENEGGGYWVMFWIILFIVIGFIRSCN